jgi:hypothetical protein
MWDWRWRWARKRLIAPAAGREDPRRRPGGRRTGRESELAIPQVGLGFSRLSALGNGDL